MFLIFGGEGKKSWELLDQSIFKLEEIPTDFTLDEAHSRQIASHRSGMPHIDRDGDPCFSAALELSTLLPRF